jgi:hypothetical protein
MERRCKRAPWGGLRRDPAGSSEQRGVTRGLTHPHSIAPVGKRRFEKGEISGLTPVFELLFGEDGFEGGLVGPGLDLDEVDAGRHGLAPVVRTVP